MDPKQWRRILDLCDEAARDGFPLYPQVASRPGTLLIGHQALNPFSFRASYRSLQHLPFEERITRLRDPELRRRILSETGEITDPRTAIVQALIEQGLHKIFPLGDPPDYEPGPERSISAEAERRGADPYEVLYDALLELDGKQLLMFTLIGYSDGDLEAVRGMLEYPHSVFGLGDGGAHCGAICDASMTTSMLCHWARDRQRGPLLPLPWVVKKMTKDTAALYGLNDRGVIAPGKKGDLNIIDMQRLDLHLPELVHDLPAEGRRLIQRARGYSETIVSGEVTFVDGEPTGALPGRLIRGARSG